MSKTIELWSDGGKLEAHKLFSDRLRSQESRSARDFKNTSQSVEKLFRIKRKFAPMFASTRQSSCLLFLFFIPVSLCYLEEVPGNSNLSAFQRWEARISSDPQLIPEARSRHHRHKIQDFQAEHQWNLKKKKDSLRHRKKNRRYVDPKDFQFLDPKPADLQIECIPLRSKRYFTDGFCTSVGPVDDHVCTGRCLPIGDLPWYAEYIKVWSRTKTHDYRCVEDVVMRQKIPFVCHNGQNRTYTIPVVQSCKCKKQDRSHIRNSQKLKHRKLQKTKVKKKFDKLRILEDDNIATRLSDTTTSLTTTTTTTTTTITATTAAATSTTTSVASTSISVTTTSTTQQADDETVENGGYNSTPS